MTTAAKNSRRTAATTAKPTAKNPRGAAARGQTSPTGRSAKRQDKASHDLTITIPVDRAASTAAKVATLPITTVQRVLPAKGGLPLYLGLGALGLAGVLEWPVAAGIAAGYTILRRGPLKPRPNGSE